MCEKDAKKLWFQKSFNMSKNSVFESWMAMARLLKYLVKKIPNPYQF